MVRQSCVVHPAKARIVLYRDWQFDVCGGDPVGAALLNFFEYWHNIKLENQPQARAYNNVAEAGGDGRPQPETLYQWHTEADIIHGLVGLAGKDKIRSAINKIVDLGFVTVHKNPNPKFSFDKTKHFLFHPDRVNRYLRELETIENLDQRNIGDRSAEISNIDQRNIGDDQRNIGDDQRNIGEQYQRLHSLTTSKEEIKDPYISPSGSEKVLPERMLTGVSVAVATSSAGADHSQGELIFEKESVDGSMGVKVARKAEGSSAKSRKATSIPFQRFQEVYNANKPASFREMTVVNPKRQTMIRGLVVTFGGVEQALIALENAMKQACVEKWCQGAALGFENFASNNKILTHHESWLAANQHSALSSRTSQAPQATTAPSRPVYEIIVGPTFPEVWAYEKELRESGVFSQRQIQEASTNFSATGIKLLHLNNASQELVPDFAT